MRIFLTLLLVIFSTLLYAKTESKSWKSNQGFDSYLRENKVPLSVKETLDAYGKQAISKIKAGKHFTEERDDSGLLIRAIIPLANNIEIDLHKLTASNNYSLSVGSQAMPDKSFDEKEDIQIKKSPKNSQVVINSNNGKFSIQDDYELEAYKQTAKLQMEIKKSDLPSSRTQSSLAYKGSKSESFGMPVRSPRITSPFSPNRYHPVLKIYRPHKGTDFGAKRGTPVMSVANGAVIFSGAMGGYGNVVKIDHGNGYVSLYAHLSQSISRVGQTVQKGDIIAFSGNSGTSSGPHLHLGIYKNGIAINPMSVIDNDSVIDKIFKKFSSQKQELQPKNNLKKKLASSLSNQNSAIYLPKFDN